MSESEEEKNLDEVPEWLRPRLVTPELAAQRKRLFDRAVPQKVNRRRVIPD